MGKPNVSDNYKGYADTDVVKNVDNMSNKMFYLVHGTADDNVHIQHSMLLAKALIEKKILFRQQVFQNTLTLQLIGTFIYVNENSFPNRFIPMNHMG
jgi:hypothetical protein